MAYVLNLDILTFDAIAKHMVVLRKLRRVEQFWTAYYASQVGSFKDAKKVAQSMLPEGMKIEPEKGMKEFLTQFPRGL